MYLRNVVYVGSVCNNEGLVRRSFLKVHYTAQLNRKMSSTVPSITTFPQPSMFDEKVRIVVKGLPQNKRVTFYCTVLMSPYCVYESFALYQSSDDGVVDIGKDSSLLGSYTGNEPMGLFWSMKPYARTKNKIARFLNKDVTIPVVYHLKVFMEEIDNLDELRKHSHINSPITKMEISRLFMAPGVKRIEVRENGLVATLFLPPGTGPFPGIINLFGGYPGILEFKSALQASNGFASLALAYIGAEGLPASALDAQDLAYFEKTVQFLKQHSSADSSCGIGVVGICKGAQIALAMATLLKDIRCVVAINGLSNAAYGDIKYKDEFFDGGYVPLERLSPGQEVSLVDYQVVPAVGEIDKRPGFFAFHKQFSVAYLIIAGLSDECVPMKFVVNEEERLLKEVDHPDYEIIRYTDTGHLIEPPYSPFCESYYQPLNSFGVNFICGGEMVSHCRSQEDSWPKIFHFLEQKLIPKPKL